MDSSIPVPPQGKLEFVTSPASNVALSRLKKTGRAQLVSRGIYAVGATLPLAEVVRLHLNEIVAIFWPGGVFCGISALSGGVPKERALFVAHPDPKRKTQLVLKGVTIYPVVGPGELPGDISLPNEIFISGQARKLVENVNLPGHPARFRAGTKIVEDEMDTLARHGGPGAVKDALEQLDVIASNFDARAVEVVRVRLAALLGTGSDQLAVVSPRLNARLGGSAFDAHRIDVLEKLVQTLNQHAPQPRLASDPQSRWQWLAFFESYFSNFIEGTEFGVDEAREIAVNGKLEYSRPKDAHDVTATYRLAANPDDRLLVPQTGDELLGILRDRHRKLMAARPEKNPGIFKRKPNYAGGTRFVDPDLVEGTLVRGFEVLNTLTDPLARAVAMMALITECHPFDDGNGRVARLTSNAELSIAGQVRIIIPTVYRNNYIAALNGFSGEAGQGQSLLAVLDFAQRWTSSVDWSNYDDACKVLESCNAFRDPGAAEITGNRLKMPDNQ